MSVCRSVPGAEPNSLLLLFQRETRLSSDGGAPLIETPQQYTERLLGYQRGKQPLKILASTPARISKLLRRVPRKRLSTRPAPDRWSVTEILSHLADAEIATGFRLRMILGSSGVTVQGYDQDAWAEVSEYRTGDPMLAFAAFQALRQWNVALLRKIPKQMWDNYGMHTERGKETVSRMSEMMAGHDINHLRQIEGILGPRDR